MENVNVEAGDRVTYKYYDEFVGEEVTITEIATYKNHINPNCVEILKIERPNYTTVFEEKELLTREEKEFIKTFVKYYNFPSVYFENDGLLFFNNGEETPLLDFPKGLKFEGVKKYREYPIEELHLDC